MAESSSLQKVMVVAVASQTEQGLLEEVVPTFRQLTDGKSSS